VSAAIDEAVALFKKRKPSDRDTTQCKVPSSYAAGALLAPTEETLPAFEFKVYIGSLYLSLRPKSET